MESNTVPPDLVKYAKFRLNFRLPLFAVLKRMEVDDVPETRQLEFFVRFEAGTDDFGAPLPPSADMGVLEIAERLKQATMNGFKPVRLHTLLIPFVCSVVPGPTARIPPTCLFLYIAHFTSSPRLTVRARSPHNCSPPH